MTVHFALSILSSYIQIWGSQNAGLELCEAMGRERDEKVDDRCTGIIFVMDHKSKLNEERHEDRKEVTSV